MNLFDSIPWWTYAVLAVAAIYPIWRYFGERAAFVAGVLFTLWLANRKGYDAGREDTQQKGAIDAHKTISEANALRSDSYRDSADPERLYEDDGFRRD